MDCVNHKLELIAPVTFHILLKNLCKHITSFNRDLQSEYVPLKISHYPITPDHVRKVVYSRPNSSIFAPFIVNVLRNLITSSLPILLQGLISIELYIGDWGGGLELLKQCYPLWDLRIKEAMEITLGHKIWRKLLDDHDHECIKDLEHIHVLQHLLQCWQEKVMKIIHLVLMYRK